MDTSEFLELARILAGAPLPESKERTSISRAYYSAFLEARARIERDTQYRIPRYGAHDKVWKSYHRTTTDARLKPIGRLLRDLKAQREQADYDIAVALDPDARTEAIGMAEEIRGMLSAIATVDGCADPKTA